MNKAIFLDRDGVINNLIYFKEEGIIDTPFTEEQFELIKLVPEAISKLNSSEYKVIITSNQPGIAKGHYSEKTFEKICKKMNRVLSKKNATIDDEFYCLHHPHAKIEKYKKNCSCRKPKIGLLTKAIKKHNIDIKKSYFIGDGMVDIEAAKRVGCKSVYIGNLNSKLTRILEKRKLVPDMIAHDLYEAVNFILKNK